MGKKEKKEKNTNTSCLTWMQIRVLKGVCQ